MRVGNQFKTPIGKSHPGPLIIIATVTLIFMGMCFVTNLVPAETIKKGEAIFKKKCISCHTVGKGDRVGPDLSGVTKRRGTDWLFSFVTDPAKMFSDKDPLAIELLEKFKGVRMPGPGLTESEVRSVIAYLNNSSDMMPGKNSSQASSGEAESGEIGDVSSGMKLFTGSAPLEKGGAPCMACHNISGLSSPGGTLGPDLSTVYEDYEDEGLSSILETLPFPTMEPIYGEHPLTERERAHLKAFFKSAGEENVTLSTLPLPMIISGIVIGLLVLIQVVWRRRLRDVRKKLVGGDR